MVTLKSLIAALTTLVLTSASPTRSNLPRQIYTGSFEIYEHTNYQGERGWLDVPQNTCINVPAAWNDRISSFKTRYTTSPGVGTAKCDWYEHAGCTGAKHTAHTDPDLTDGSGFHNDRISSVYCP
ncbi:hypothetical protein V8F20_011145 [Naviculisporaceae sp. PSN 640]